MQRIAVLTSGGDAPGMNAAIRAVVRRAIYEGLEVVGVERGFAGLFSGALTPLGLSSVADIIHRGGTVLRTARAPAMLAPEGPGQAAAALRREGVEALVVIGGDGSLHGALRLSQEGMPCVGIPATIDNDIVGTMPSVGFDTAVNTVVAALDKIRDTASAHERVFVVEVMGRASGQIALAAGLAGGAEVIMLPEVDLKVEDIGERLKRSRERGKKHSIILVAEGSGHGFQVGEAIEQLTGLETRVTVLGHLQRGGNPSALDRRIASELGAEAVEVLCDHLGAMMVGWQDEGACRVPLAAVLDRSRALNQRTYALAAILAI